MECQPCDFITIENDACLLRSSAVCSRNSSLELGTPLSSQNFIIDTDTINLNNTGKLHDLNVPGKKEPYNAGPYMKFKRLSRAEEKRLKAMVRKGVTSFMPEVSQPEAGTDSSAAKKIFIPFTRQQKRIIKRKVRGGMNPEIAKKVQCERYDYYLRKIAEQNAVEKANKNSILLKSIKDSSHLNKQESHGTDEQPCTSKAHISKSSNDWEHKRNENGQENNLLKIKRTEADVKKRLENAKFSGRKGVNRCWVKEKERQRISKNHSKKAKSNMKEYRLFPKTPFIESLRNKPNKTIIETAPFKPTKQQFHTDSKTYQLNIKHIQHPKIMFKNEEIEAIRLCLLEEIDKSENFTTDIGFSGTFKYNGWLVLKCHNKETRKWAIEAVNKIKPFQDAKIKAETPDDQGKEYICIANIPSKFHFSHSNVLKMLSNENRLCTWDWRIVETASDDTGNGLITFVVDEQSKKIIQERKGILKFNRFNIHMRIINNV